MTEIEKRAIEFFGVTSDFGEAGYMLKDGTLLDFSEKKDGGMEGFRTLDHREVSELYDNEVQSTEAMKRFVKDTGAVRIGFSRYHNTATVDITTEEYISKLQEIKICRLAVLSDNIYIDYYNDYYSETPHKQYSVNMPRMSEIKKVLEDIKSGGK